MRLVKRNLKRKKYKLYPWYNLYWQLWYNYHHSFFGSLIFRGKKILAFNTFLKIKKELKFKEDFDPFLVFLIAMLKISPQIILLPLKLSGVVYGVPFPMNQKKQVTFAIRWIIKLLRDNHRVFKVSTIVELLISSIYNKGPAIQKKMDLYDVSLKNRHLIKRLKFFK